MADIDECLNEELNNCSKSQGLCANLDGTYDCQCKAGYSGDGFTCKDVNECLDSNICSEKNNTKCVNLEGSFNCTCLEGHEGFNCTDVNECLDSNVCSWKNNSMCVNTEGSFTCTCRTGYEEPNCTSIPTVSPSSTSTAPTAQTSNPTSLLVPSSDSTTTKQSTTEIYTSTPTVSKSSSTTSIYITTTSAGTSSTDSPTDHASTSTAKEISTIHSTGSATTSTEITSTGMTTAETRQTNTTKAAVSAVTPSTTVSPTTTKKTMQTSTTKAAVPASTTVSPTTTKKTMQTSTTKAAVPASTTLSPTTMEKTMQTSATKAAVPASTTLSLTTMKKTMQTSTTKAAVPASTTVSPTTTKKTMQTSTTKAAVPASTTLSSTTMKKTTQTSTTKAAVPAVTPSTTLSPTTMEKTTQTSATKATVPASTTLSPTTTKKTMQTSTTKAAVPASTTLSPTTMEKTTQTSTTKAAVPASTTLSPTTMEKTTQTSATKATVLAATTVSPTTMEKTTQTSTTKAAVPASTTVSPTTTGIPTTASVTTTAPPITLRTTPTTATTSTISKTLTTTTTTVHTSTTTTTSATVPSTVQTTEASGTLFEYGTKVGDQMLTTAALDVTSPVFKPEIDFAFGSTQHRLLYFTDNGVIVFPKSETEIFSYTYPPLNGFTGLSQPPMIAAFWSNADLSENVGNIFYQEYKTYDGISFSLVQQVEEVIKTYCDDKYQAKWTLKITWENVPAFPAAETKTQTNTYQAVVTTNGKTSFALIKYLLGGMNWDVSKLVSDKVVIGFSTGDGFFTNEEIRQPAAANFKPDQYPGPKTGLQGVRLYKLIKSTPLENYKADCLSWFTLEPNPSVWNQGLLPCPCTFPQGQADNRFRNSNLDTSTKVLRSASPNAFGAGQRCIYTKGNALIEGWQERYWTSTQSAPSIQNNQYDLDPYNWCCEKVDNPSFCEYYRNKRPSINCKNYRPPTRAMMLGDPHFTTLDGHTYTFNGLGDFVLLNVKKPNNNTIFKLHGRTVQTGAALATNFMAFAAQHETTTVQMILKGNDSIDVLLNNHTVQFVSSPNDNKEIFRNGSSYLEKNGNASIIASFSSGISVTVTAEYGMLLAITNLPEDFKDRTKGLLGVWNGDQNDDFTMPNGSAIPINSSESTIFDYGKTWEVPSDSSIFTIGKPTPNNSFTPRFLDDLQQQNESLYSMVAMECNGNTQCIFDAISTGQTEIGLSTATRNAEFQEDNNILNSFPPEIEGPLVISAELSQKVISHYKATGNNATFRTYTSNDLNVTGNGILTWHPKTISMITLEIEAIGSNNLSSVITPQLVICGCGENGTCLTNETTRNNGSSVYKAACDCTPGFTGSNCQNAIDRCQAISCFPGVNCSSPEGCGACPTGLTGNGMQCSDIDECKVENSCSPNATCTNVVRSYTCTCNSGFSGNGTFCTAIDACNNSPCSPNATCQNTAWSFSCTCKEGFSGNGTFCTAIDACNNSPCSPNATCQNTAWSFSCTCKEGFSGNGTFCTAIDACNNSPCSPNATCQNTAGSFSCTCKEGFSGFIAKPVSSIPKRSVNITLQIQNLTADVLNDRNSPEYQSLTNSTKQKVHGILSNVEYFSNDSEYVFWSEGENVTTAVVSLFNYDGRKTTIDFLNEDLHEAILRAFNGERFKRALRLDDITFKRLTKADIQDLNKLSSAELLEYFSCNNTQFAGYVVQFDGQNGVICRSPCELNYCYNQGTCQHLLTGPSCKCVPRTIYSSYGDHCEHLSMNLRAFFGILFGALAFLLLLMLAIFFCVWKCKKSGRLRNETCSTRNVDTTFSFKNHPFSSKMQNTSILPSLDDKNLSPLGWRPSFDHVSSTAKMRIERPSLKKSGTESEIP
ncbi:mucin-4-like [Mustelus asterias]